MRTHLPTTTLVITFGHWSGLSVLSISYYSVQFRIWGWFSIPTISVLVTTYPNLVNSWSDPVRTLLHILLQLPIHTTSPLCHLFTIPLIALDFMVSSCSFTNPLTYLPVNIPIPPFPCFGCFCHFGHFGHSGDFPYFHSSELAISGGDLELSGISIPHFEAGLKMLSKTCILSPKRAKNHS